MCACLRVTHKYTLCFTEKLENIKIEVPEVTQTEVGQKQKLHVILEEINHILPNAWNTDKWNVDSKFVL